MQADGEQGEQDEEFVNLKPVPTPPPAAATDHAAAVPLPAEAQQEPSRVLSPAAQRALAEAAERRAALDRKAEELARTQEVAGRGGPDPVRYDDWEVKGIASDF